MQSSIRGGAGATHHAPSYSTLEAVESMTLKLRSPWYSSQSTGCLSRVRRCTSGTLECEYYCEQRLSATIPRPDQRSCVTRRRRQRQRSRDVDAQASRDGRAAHGAEGGAARAAGPADHVAALEGHRAVRAQADAAAAGSGEAWVRGGGHGQRAGRGCGRSRALGRVAGGREVSLQRQHGRALRGREQHDGGGLDAALRLRGPAALCAQRVHAL